MDGAPGQAANHDPGVQTAASVRSLDRAARVFFGFGSPRVLAAGLALSAALRLVAAIGGWAPVTLWDGAALATVVGLVPFVEWFVHRVVLHARPRTIGGIVIDPGVGHREHHDHPATVNWVVLRAVDAVAFQAINAALATTVIALPLWLAGPALGGPALVGPVLSGMVVALAALAHYEWSHFLFHTAYRPRSARYRRLKANHLRHHWRDERSWLGITSNLADQLLGSGRQSGA